MPTRLRTAVHSQSFTRAVRDFQKFCHRVANSTPTPAMSEVAVAMQQALAMLWKEYLSSEQQRAGRLRKAQWKMTRGAGLLAFPWARWL